MKRAALLLALLLALGCSSAPRAEKSADEARLTVPSDIRFKEGEAAPHSAGAPRPAPGVSQSRSLTSRLQPPIVDIYLDTGSHPLAAYTIELRYDPQVVAVLDVSHPGRGGFPGTPMVEPASFARGVTRIVGLHTGASLPRGRVRVARVHFRPASASGSSSLSVSILGIYGPGGKPINGQAVLTHHRVIVLSGK